MVSGIVDKVKVLFGPDATWNERIGALLGIFDDIGTFVFDTIRNLWVSIFNLFGFDGSALAKKYWDPIANVIGAVVDWIVLAFTNPKAALDKLWSGIKNLGQWLWDNTVMKAWDAITGLFTFGAAEEKEAAGDLKVGETKGIFSKILHAIIPEGVFTFLKDPMGWVWVNILGITTGTDGKMPSAAEAAEQIKSGEADGIFAKVMGAFLPQGMIEFILDPIDWIFVNVLKLGGEGEKKKSTLQKAGYILGTAVELFKKVLKAILPDGLVDFITAPIDWFFESVLNIKTGEVLDSVSEAHGVEKGDANGIWQSMLDAILPAGLAKFLGDPIGYIFTDILNLGGEGEKKKSALEQSKVVAGVAVGLFKSVLEAILPDGLVAFMFKPLDWLFGKMGISVGESMKSAEEAAGVTAGDAKGLWSSILGAILPAGLVDFITNPLKWLLAKAGIVKNEETGELMSGDKVLTKEEAAKQATGIFSKVLKAILPDGLVDFIMGPVNWVLSKLGLTGEKKKPDDGTGGWKFPGLPTLADIKEFLPMWLTDPFGYFKSLFKGKEGAARKAEIQEEIDKQQAQIDEGDTRDWKLRSRETIIEGLQEELKNVEGRSGGGFLGANKLAIVGEKGPELFMSSGPGTVISNDFAKAAFKASMAGQPPAGAGGGGSSSTVMITNAPSTSNVANTKVETAAGVSDPHTQLAGVY
jgi:hypothetical protein